MGFFDLNIPYYESDRNVADKSSRKNIRLKLMIKAMELGYIGVAYNRTIKGVMSESDRCSTSLFPMSSPLKLAPTLLSSVKLHRDLLGVPMSTPFRQYTRLTVVVDSPAQALALNSGNPILKSYDIVAVRPMNQNAFEQACQGSEVDLIAIDFSEKLPFRLKQPIIKAALERGVYFELTYSSIIDSQVRRQMISNAKLLVDWTRGANLIFSSAASSVTELRGPYDVANLSYLLGLTMERAKSAISKNCRSLIANALRKKDFYKEAIRVEHVSSSGQLDSEEPAFDDWLKWDPISSGEGDLVLDDMAKSFNAPSKVSNIVKAIDFTSVVDRLPSQGLQIKDLISVTNVASEPLDIGEDLSSAKVNGIAVRVHGECEQLDGLNLHPEANRTSLIDTSVRHQSSNSGNTQMPIPPADTLGGLTNAKEIGTFAATMFEEPNFGVDTPTEAEMDNFQSQSCLATCEAHVIFSGDATLHTSKDSEVAPICDTGATTEIYSPSEDLCFSVLRGEDSNKTNVPGSVVGAEDVVMGEVFTETDIKSKDKISLDSCDVSLVEGVTGTEHIRKTRDVSGTFADGLPMVESYAKSKDENGYLVANDELPEDYAMEEPKQIEDHSMTNCSFLDNFQSVQSRVKRRPSLRAFPFSSKRLLNPVSFKKKARRFRNTL